MSSSSESNHFSAGLKLTNLIPRQALLKEIQEAMTPASPTRTIFLNGLGGNGKTELLTQGLELARAAGYIAAQKAVDLNDDRTFATTGLMDAIVETFQDADTLFPNFVRERNQERQMAVRGLVKEIQSQRETTEQAFLQDLSYSGQERKIVLALDTAEQLVYGGVQAPSTVVELAKTWNWLQDRLLQQQSVIFLMAGRERECEPLLKELRALLGNQLVEISVGPFSEAETAEYVRAVAQLAASQGNESITNYLPNLDNKTRAQIYNCSGGQPIWLGLLMDYLYKAEGNTDKFQDLLAVGERAMRTTQDTVLIEEELVHRIQDEWTDVKDTLLAMARLQRGATPELLAALLEESVDKAQARLDQVRGLSFVKTRPNDSRIYLHDEMYRILHRRILDNEPARKAEELEIIGNFHDRAIEQIKRELDDLYAPAEEFGKTELDLNALESKHAERQRWLLDKLFYRLREDTLAGWRLYYRYAREAALSGDIPFDIQLRGEVFAFLAEQDPSGRQENVARLSRTLVNATMLVQKVVRFWAAREYQKAIEEAENIRIRDAALIAEVAPSTDAIITIWTSVARTDKGGSENWEQAYADLSHVIQELGPYVPQDFNRADALVFRTAAVLAFAYRARAYNERICGRMREAVRDYERALKIWKKLNVEVEEAQTQNDLGYALAQLGEYRRARNYVESALRLRRKLGARYTVALSLNTRGDIDLREGHFEPTNTSSLRALALFQALGQNRGEGLARITLSELYRRYAVRIYKTSPNEARDYLDRARTEAEQARKIFHDLEEQARIVDALIELGCSARDLVRLANQYPDLGIVRDEMIQTSENALLQAAETAGDAILYRNLDALVNLGWLAYFANQDDLIEKRINDAMMIISDEYRFSEDAAHVMISEERASTLVWTQLGKAHILHGHYFFRKYQKNKKETTHLEMAAQHYTLGLQYSIKFSGDYRDLRKAETQINERLDSLKLLEQEWFDAAVTDTIKRFRLQNVRILELSKGAE